MKMKSKNERSIEEELLHVLLSAKRGSQRAVIIESRASGPHRQGAASEKDNDIGNECQVIKH